MWLYCSESPILPFEMKWRPAYLRVNYSSIYKFILSFYVNLHVNLAAFPLSKKDSKSTELLQKGVVFHWIREVFTEGQQVNIFTPSGHQQQLCPCKLHTLN